MSSTQNIQVRLIQWLVAGCLSVFCGTLNGQLPAVPNDSAPGVPQTSGEALNAASNIPGLTINTGSPCCKPPTIWDFLGCSQIKQHLTETSAAIHQLPLIKNLGPMFNSVLSTVGLANPSGAPGIVPGAPGPPAPPGAPQGPGAVAAKIEADKKAAEDIIQNLNYLAQQDCNRYPEVIPAILQELDNPDELVRYTALTALKPQCKDFRCSTLPATRIYFHLKHRPFCRACGCCAGCQCQDQVISRLTDLLLDKNALNHPKETSFRVRALATEILTDCLENRGRDAKPRKTSVEPDPERGPLPDPHSTSQLLPIPDTAMQERNDADESTDIEFASGRNDVGLPSGHTVNFLDEIKRANFDSSKSNSGDFISQVSDADIDATSAVQKQLSIIEETESSLKPVEEADSDVEGAEFETSHSRLCKARLELAMIGDREQELEIVREAERICRTRSQSAASVISMATACRLACYRSVQETSDQKQWIARRVAYLKFVVVHLKVRRGFMKDLLQESADLCAKHGLANERLACLRTISTCFPEKVLDESANKDIEQCADYNAEYGEGESVYQLRPDSYSVHAFPTEPDEPKNTPTRNTKEKVQIQQTSMTAESPLEDSKTSSVPSVRSTRRSAESDCFECQPVTMTFTLLPDIAVEQDITEIDRAQTTVFEQQPEGAPFENSVDEDLVQGGIKSPYFSTKPLSQDLYDRAMDAISVNSEAMGFPDCDQDDLKFYDNSSAIGLSPFALFNMDSAQTGNVFRIGYRPVFGYSAPDRSQYFWSKIGAGGPPLPEKEIDFQDLTIYNENGTDTTSVFTELPIRFISPERNANTAGPGDLVIGVKTIILQDSNYRICSVMRTITPVGSAKRGLGHGFLALEPGLLSMWRIGRKTHLFGDLQFQFPIGADPEFSGQVLRTSVGLTRVLWSNVISPPQPSSQGLILTVETIITNFLTGKETAPTGLIQGAEQTAVTQHFGLRRMWSDRFSTGMDLGFGMPSMGLYDLSFQTQAQWVY